MHEVLSEHDRRRTYVFSSHFYTRLAKPYSSTSSSNVEGVSMCRQRYAGVQRWTKNINIFEKDFVVVPINEHAHWFVAIICFPRMVVNTLQLHNEDSHNEEIKKPCILIFDSLYGTRTSQVAKILKGYLYYEYISKMRKCKSFSKIFLPTAYPIVPKQSNVTDCGLFLLQYVETFFKDPIRNFTLPLRDLKDWFDPIVIRRKRKEIVILIGRLAKDFHKDENFELPDIVVDDHKVAKSTFNDDNKYTLSSKTLYKLKNIKSQPKNINVKSFYNLNINHSSSEKIEKPISMIKSNRLLVEDRENSSYADKKNNSLLFSHPAGMMSPPSEKVLNLIKSSVKQNKKSSIKDWLNSNKFEKTGTSSSNSFSSLSFEALKNDIKISPRTSYSDFLKAKRKFQEAEKRNYDSSD
ncbi:PREDICTED: sentrin-specific protease 7-like [Ceratosolen solmsi marchali]|uniref:Sentrin-specific protease 7-like n=1 Tax=Ceratosolen solmsi marchali TaxID=326594 RepID=A0AAJ7DZ43_9HYME|nr:PREDICTED: sentrin-specific protease 7-like [Ceratosolen solmsi marchali]